MDNKTQVVLGTAPSQSGCAQLVGDYFDGAATFDAATFLQLTDSEKTKLAGFLSHFASPDYLSSEQIPSSMSDVSRLPDRIR